MIRDVYEWFLKSHGHWFVFWAFEAKVYMFCNYRPIAKIG